MTAPHGGWPLGRTPADYVLGHVRAVLGDRVVDDARVVVRDGRVAEVGPHPSGSGADVDGGGLHLLPGLVDVHSDTLAREARPRPGAAVSPARALAAAGVRLRGAGVTTAYHGVAFQARSSVGTEISSPLAEDLLGALDEAGAHVLHRLDVRCPHGRRLLEARLESRRDDVLLVSHEDHTPGQGQYADPATMERWLVEAEGYDARRAAAHVVEWRASRDELLDHRTDTLAWLGDLAHAGRIRLLGHDPATTEDVGALVARGGAVAEFPTTAAAARSAAEAGLPVVVGAPNVLRGGSHAGNVSARDLVAAGWVTALTSDYLPHALLPAAVALVDRGLLDLPAAVRLVTSGPAACAGLDDRGSVAEGRRADLVLADLSAPRGPTVVAVLGSGEGPRHGTGGGP